MPTYPRTTVAAIISGLVGGIAAAIITTLVVTTLTATTANITTANITNGNVFSTLNVKNTNATGTLAVAGATSASSTLQVTGASRLYSTLTADGLSTLSAGVKVGSGTTIKHSYSASSSKDFAAINLTSCSTTTMTVTGATTDDALAVAWPASLMTLASSTHEAYVSSAGVVTLKVCNWGAAATADPAAGVVRVSTFKYY